MAYTVTLKGGKAEAFGDKDGVVMFIGENHLIRRKK